MSETTSITLLEVQSQHYDNCSMWYQTHDRLILNRQLTTEELKEVKKYFKKDSKKGYFYKVTVKELKELYKKDREEQDKLYLEWKDARIRKIVNHFKEEYNIYCYFVDYEQSVEIYDMYEW